MSNFAINSSTAVNNSLFNQVFGSNDFNAWQNTIFATPTQSFNDMFMNMLFNGFKFTESPDINMNKGSGNFKNFNVGTNLRELKGVYNPKLSAQLADAAYQTAKNKNTIGKCYRGVKDASIKANLDAGTLSGESAYEAYAQLKNHKNFTEVKVAKKDLKNLPAGCFVVWDASEGHPHGHITTTLGNGKEASDHVQDLIIRNAKFAVFVPTSTNQMA